jgi:hypothetical protein
MVENERTTDTNNDVKLFSLQAIASLDKAVTSCDSDWEIEFTKAMAQCRQPTLIVIDISWMIFFVLVRSAHPEPRKSALDYGVHTLKCKPSNKLKVFFIQKTQN